MKFLVTSIRTRYSTATIATGFIGFSLLVVSIGRFFILSVVDETFVHDARVWRSVGEMVLAGQDLYLQVPDNKPPLWEGIVIAAAWTPAPYLAMLCVVGIGSALLTWSVYGLTETTLGSKLGLVAATGVAFGILVMTQGFINNKTMGLALLFFGLAAVDSEWTGLAYGAAILVAQQLVLTLPVVYWWERARNGPSSAHHQLGQIVGLCIIAYLSVGVIWGVDAMIAGIEQTVLLSPAYILAESEFQTAGAPLSDPARYAAHFRQRAPKYAPLYLLGIIGISRQLSGKESGPRVVKLSILLTLAAGTVLTIRVYRHYWLLILPGLAITASYGVGWFLEE